MKQRRIPTIFNLLFFLSLLLGTNPWQDPRIAQAKYLTPSQALHTQMQRARQQPAAERTAISFPVASALAGPPAPSLFQRIPYDRSAPIAPAALPSASADATAAPYAITTTTTLLPETAPAPPATTPDQPSIDLEIQKLTRQQATAAQRQMFLPLVRSVGPVRITEVKITSLGGQLRSPDGSVRLDVPADAVSEEVWIRLTQDGPHPPAGARQSLGVFFELTARTAAGQPVTRFGRALSLRVTYPQSANTADGTQGLFYYHEQQRLWLPLATSDNTAIRLLTATTDHFTQFAAFPTQAPTCPFVPGVPADPPAKAAIQTTYANLGLACPTTSAYQWGGTWAQTFPNGVVVYNSVKGIAFFIGDNYRQAYVSAGGPGGFLGLPREHSFNAVLPPVYYKDYFSDFTGTPIQKYEYGFVGRNSGIWQGSRYYPLACDVSATVIKKLILVEPTQADPDPPPIVKKKISFTVGGIPDPGNLNSTASFGSALIVIDNRTTGEYQVKPMVMDGDRFIYELPDELDAGDIIQFGASLTRVSDGRAGYAPQMRRVNDILYSLPSGYATFQRSSCSGTILRDDEIYTPPSDTRAIAFN